MFKKSFWKIMTALFVIVMLAALCFFGACSSDDEENASDAAMQDSGDGSGDFSSGAAEDEDISDGTAVGETGNESGAYVTGITMSYENAEISYDGIVLEIGQSTTLKANVEMSDGGKYSGRVDWTASDSDVADFTTTGGVLEAKAEGTVTITVTARDTSYSDTCSVTVVEPDTYIRAGIKDDVRGFGYRDPVTGEYSGLEIELAQMIGEELGYDEEHIILMSVLPEDREAYLTDDVVDYVVATYSVTAGRASSVNFSSPYYSDYVGVLKSASYGNDSLTSISEVFKYVYDAADPDASEDITPCRVGAVKDSTAYGAFFDYLTDSDNDITWTTPGTGVFFEYTEYGDYDECEKAMKDGEIDLFVADHSILMSHTPDGATMLTDVLETESYAVGTKKAVYAGEETLTDEINAMIDEWLEDETIDTIISRWIDIDAGTILDPDDLVALPYDGTNEEPDAVRDGTEGD